ncbi:glycosyltransferase family 4 protein [Akkermansiaceae bacterium]|nr:glycosyltransferase family 4 protein [Akkermansiaceae bacterium]
MKIAQISHCYKPVVGGQEVYIEALQGVLSKAGISSKIFQSDKGVKDDDVFNVLRLKGLPRLIHGVEQHCFDFFLRKFHQKKIDEYDLTIAHYALHARGQRHRKNRTIVLSHGVEWHTENQTWDDRRREAAARECLEDFPHVVNDTHYLRHFGLDAVPGERCFEEVFPNKWFIPNCVDPIRFSPGKGHPSLVGKKVILVPRQLTPDRGIHLAIQAFRHVLDADPDVHLCLLGNRKKENPYLRSLDELIKDLGLKDRAYFAPGVSNQEIPEWYNGSELTLIPTLRREGTSLSALESMSCGVATVSTNVAGLADLPTVQANPNGEDLAAAILDTLKNRAEIASGQRAKVNSVFNLENWSSAWLNVVSSIAG